MACVKRHVKHVINQRRCGRRLGHSHGHGRGEMATARLKRPLKQLKVGDAIFIRHHYFAVQPGAAELQGGQRLGQLRHFCRPVMAVAGKAVRLALVQPGHQPVAVKLQLVNPVAIAWRCLGERGQLRLQHRRQCGLDRCVR